jgi:hypothetical protein
MGDTGKPMNPNSIIPLTFEALARKYGFKSVEECHEAANTLRTIEAITALKRMGEGEVVRY